MKLIVALDIVLLTLLFYFCLPLSESTFAEGLRLQKRQGNKFKYDVKDCASTETKTKRLKVKYLGFKTNDDELRTGFSVSGKLAFETYEKITSGLVSTVALYEGILIAKESIDLCEVVSKYSQCPLQPGQTVVLQSEMTPVPNYILSGDYMANVTAKDQENKELMCLHIDLNIL